MAGFLYWDAQADDARLALTVLRTAVVNYGAVAANYAAVIGLLSAAGGAGSHGARLEDGTEIRAEVVVNATGVWSDQIRGLDEGAEALGTLRPAKGIHLTFPAARLPLTAAAVVPVPGDRRSIFLVPWGEFTYVGTTDTDYSGPLDDPQCTPEDVAYLLARRQRRRHLAADTGRHLVGLGRPATARQRRPSSQRTADLSRRHRVTPLRAGLVTVTGRQAHHLPPDGGRRRRRGRRRTWAGAPGAARPGAWRCSAPRAATLSTPAARPAAGRGRGRASPTWPAATAPRPEPSSP